MTENSIEFQPMPGDEQESETIRNSFRIPASDKDNVLAVFYNKTYTVVNLSKVGIAIHSDSCLEFESGQIIDDAELVLGSRKISGLSAKVVHCSVHDSGELQFGLAWLNMTPEDKSRLETILEQMKVMVLKTGQSPEEKA